MSYGISSAGTTAYGGVVADLSIESARAVSTNVLRVSLTKEPQNISPQLVGDATNPRTWMISRSDTGRGFTVLSAVLFDGPGIWDIRVLEPFGGARVTHSVSAPTLKDTEGSAIDAPRSASFKGITSVNQSSNENKAAKRNFSVRDIRNPGAVAGDGGDGGSFSIGPNGDYVLHQGTEFVQKQIFRRLETIKGGFQFLPDFGVGLRVKEPLPAGDLVSLQKEISDQIREEPEVDKVRVVVTQDQNHLTVVVQARLSPTGQQIDVSYPIPLGA